MLVVLAIALLIAGMPLACWVLMAQTERWRLLGALPLLAACLAIVAVLAAWPWQWWLAVVYGVAAVSWISAAGSRDARHRARSGPEGQTGSTFDGQLVVPGYLAFTGLLSGLLLLLQINDVSLDPSPEFVLPLPAEMQLDQTRDLGCGSQVCSRELVVEGRADLTAKPGLLAAVVDFLEKKRGWDLDEHGSGCRDSGLFKLGETCIEVRPKDDRVSIVVSDRSLWP